MQRVPVESSITTFHDEKRVDDVPNPLSSEYLHKREMAERAAAKQSGTVLARAVHQELAKLYSEQRRRLNRPQQ